MPPAVRIVRIPGDPGAGGWSPPVEVAEGQDRPPGNSLDPGAAGVRAFDLLVDEREPIRYAVPVRKVAVTGFADHDASIRVLPPRLEEESREWPALFHAPVVVEVEADD